LYWDETGGAWKLDIGGTIKTIAFDEDLDTHTGRTDNPHSVTKAQVGLGNVDNTSDADKPVSTAQNTAISLKLDKATYNTKINSIDTTLTNLQNQINNVSGDSYSVS
jgi:hypothetical protein